MKYVYLVKTGPFSEEEKRFNFTTTEHFATRGKAIKNINESIAMNKGYDVKQDVFDDVFEKQFYLQIDYKTRTYNNSEIKLRTILLKKELK